MGRPGCALPAALLHKLRPLIGSAWPCRRRQASLLLLLLLLLLLCILLLCWRTLGLWLWALQQLGSLVYVGLALEGARVLGCRCIALQA